MAPGADAIVVLGCRIAPSGTPSSAARRRAERGARAFREGVAPLVIVSGGRTWGAFVEADALGRELARLGVPEAVIVRERRSRSTRENALYTSRVMAERGLSRPALVTCAWHMPRALANFRAMGTEPIALPAPAPPAPLVTALRRRLHEAIGGWIDAGAMRWRATARRAP